MATQVVDAALAAARPWRTIWLAPRRTMRELLAAEVRPGLKIVVALAALHVALGILGGLAAKGELSASMAEMPVALAVLRIVFGVLVGPFLLAISGGWFGGQANPDDIRQSVAWSYAPLAVTAVCWIPLLLMPGELVGSASGAAALLKALLLIAVGLVDLSALLWTLVLQVVTLAEVQHFSTGRSLVAILVWVIPAMLLSALS